ncbi:S-glutathionyl-(chloro)hydroquinone reductase [Saitoella coloradoensis]
MDKAPNAPGGPADGAKNDRDITGWAGKDGSFKRQVSSFRDVVGESPKFPVEKDRYHLYVSLACPWAHRTLIVRHLKGLQDIIPVSVVHWEMLKDGWKFAPEGCPGATNDPNENAKFMKDLYHTADPDYSARWTVPVLWDKKQRTVVNNESSEIIRMFYTAFDDIIDEKYKGVTYYPEDLASKIDKVNEWIYDTVNNGVYKSGFATTQEAYEAAVYPLFSSLDRIESMLASSSGPYLLGDKLTEADIRLYPTIVRFDPVYVQHFKCNINQIRDPKYERLHKWMRHLYWDLPAFGETTNFEHIKKHYTKSHSQINPKAITPVGPLPDILPKDE